MKKWVLISLILVVILVIAGAFFYFHNFSKKSFDTSSLVVKYTLRQGDLVNTQISIINTASSTQKFDIELSGLKGFGYINETSFVLDSGKQKDIQIFFKNFSSFVPSVYTGNLIIRGESVTKEIPVIIELQSKNILFATNLEVSPAYESVLRGDKFSGVIKILNLDGSGKQLIHIVYAIKDLSNKIIVSEAEDLGVENELVYTKTLTVPNYIKAGKYIFSVEIKYKDSDSIASNIFDVLEKKPMQVNYILVLIFVFLLAILILIYFVFKERDNLFLELEKQHKAEMNLVISNINTCKQAELSQADMEEKKKKIETRYRVIIKNTKKNLRERQKKQDELFKKLRKENKEKEMQNKLNEWKKKGYDTSILEAKILTKKDIDKKIQEYQKKGYNVDMFKK